MSLPDRVIKAQFEGQSTEALTGRLYTAATKALVAIDFPSRPTVASLTAFLIVHTCQVREEEPLTTFSFVGTAIRVGMWASVLPTGPQLTMHSTTDGAAP